jgi:hypothetical protein
MNEPENENRKDVFKTTVMVLLFLIAGIFALLFWSQHETGRRIDSLFESVDSLDARLHTEIQDRARRKQMSDSAQALYWQRFNEQYKAFQGWQKRQLQ